MTAAALAVGIIYAVVTLLGFAAGVMELAEASLVRRARGAHMILTCWAWPGKLLRWIPATWRHLRELDDIHRGIS